MLPARRNPFAMERIAREIPFDPAWCETSWEKILKQLERQNWRGQVVGPHGSGKTTFLDELGPLLEARGFEVVRGFLNEDNRRLSHDTWEPSASQTKKPRILLLDGAEQLNAFAWRSFLRRARKAFEGGIVVTTHQQRSGPIPLLLETRTSPQMLSAFIERLAPDFAQQLTPPEIEEIHHATRGNLREALWRCYDRAGAAP